MTSMHVRVHRATNISICRHRWVYTLMAQLDDSDWGTYIMRANNHHRTHEHVCITHKQHARHTTATHCANVPCSFFVLAFLLASSHSIMQTRVYIIAPVTISRNVSQYYRLIYVIYAVTYVCMYVLPCTIVNLDLTCSSSNLSLLCPLICPIFSLLLISPTHSHTQVIYVYKRTYVYGCSIRPCVHALLNSCVGVSMFSLPITSPLRIGSPACSS
jgi:hypothetical protein